MRHIYVTDATLAQRMTETPATRGTGGNLGFVDRTSRLPPELINTALQLKTPGDISGPFALGGGYEILRRVRVRAAAVSPLGSVEDAIRQRLYRERRTPALDARATQLHRDTHVEFLAPELTTVGNQLWWAPHE